MVLINKQPKLSCHMATIPINDRRLIKPVMLMCFCSAKFLLYGVNKVSFSNDHTIISSLICGGQNKTYRLHKLGSLKCEEGRTDGRTDGRNGPTTRPAFAKATQVKIGKGGNFNK